MRPWHTRFGDDEVPPIEVADEAALPVADDRGDRDEVHRRSESCRRPARSNCAAADSGSPTCAAIDEREPAPRMPRHTPKIVPIVKIVRFNDLRESCCRLAPVGIQLTLLVGITRNSKDDAERRQTLGPLVE